MRNPKANPEAGSGLPPSAEAAPPREILPGDVYFADHGQSSHAYPTLWMVCSSKTALEPHGDLRSEDAQWFCLKAAAGSLPFFRRGMGQTEWQGHNCPERKHILYPCELRAMVYVGNFYDWCEAALGKAASESERGERSDPQQENGIPDTAKPPERL